MDKSPQYTKAAASENLSKNLEAIETIIGTASEQLAIPFANIVEMLKKRRKEQLAIPSCIFRNLKLGILEAVVKYLKEEHELAYHKIAATLRRDDRVIWVAYSKASKKSREHFKIELPNEWIPVSVFANTKLGPLENLSKYLIEKNHDYKSAAVLLNRSPKSIWACYKRSRR